ncbi:MAG: hypothetical protein LBG23_01625 [Endomicrobium sp.]|jgi:hypothetical protein|nr:hypothetical protein [Endomicrobium sp.]
MPRLELLTQKVAGKPRVEIIQKIYDESGHSDQAKKFINENSIKNSDGKIVGLNPGALDK